MTGNVSILESCLTRHLVIAWGIHTYSVREEPRIDSELHEEHEGRKTNNPIVARPER